MTIRQLAQKLHCQYPVAHRLLDVSRKTQMNEIAKHRYIAAYNFAGVYAGLGDKDQAFQWLERSLQDRAWDITYLKVDPMFDNLHSDPRFADLVRRVGL